MFPRETLSESSKEAVHCIYQSRLETGGDFLSYVFISKHSLMGYLLGASTLVGPGVPSLNSCWVALDKLTCISLSLFPGLYHSPGRWTWLNTSTHLNYLAQGTGRPYYIIIIEVLGELEITFGWHVLLELWGESSLHGLLGFTVAVFISVQLASGQLVCNWRMTDYPHISIKMFPWLFPTKYTKYPTFPS